EHASRLFDSSDAELSRITAAVAAADVAVFASPTYKASYTGMLKAFLDRYGSNGLAGVLAVPVMTGGWAGHTLAVEVHLRPVLVELGATVPVRGLYVTEPELTDVDAAIAGWAAAAEEDERGGRGGAGFGVPHPADHDLVVAAGQAVLHRALQDGEHPVEPGTAGRSVPVPDPVPGRGQPAPGEVGGQLPLRRREHVYHERAVPLDGPQRHAAEVEADQDERRIEGQRGDRVRGGAYRRAVGTDRRDHCDTGREMAHRVPELLGRDLPIRHLTG